MRKYIKMFSFLLVWLFLFSFFNPLFAKHSKKSTKPVSSKPYKSPGSIEELPVKSAILVEAENGITLFEKNPHEKLPPASIVKLMTMLVVMEKLKAGEVKLTDQVKVSRRASHMGGSQVFLQEGEVFSLENMMKAITIASANDASLAVAEFIDGSEEAFVETINAKAKELGMKDSNFVNTHGLPPERGETEQNLISAYDLSLVARELIKYPVILQWCSMRQEKFRNGKFTLTNTNKLIEKYEGMDGLKTGYTKEAGFCLVATAKRGNRRLISAVLGAESNKERFAETARLLDYGFSFFKRIPVFKKGDITGTIPVENGEVKKVQIEVSQDTFAVVKKRDEKKVEKKISPLPKLIAPFKKGTKAGIITTSLDGKVIAKADIVAAKDVEKARLILRLLRKLGLSWILYEE